jgi:adenylate cyclase
MKISKQQMWKWGVGLFLMMILSVFYLTNFWKTSNEKWWDKYFACQPSEVSQKIVVVEIDDPSLYEIGIWPWPRTVMVGLLNKIQSFAPEKIGVDVNFVEKTNIEDDLALQQFLNSNDNVYIPIEGEGLRLAGDKWQAKQFIRPYYLLGKNRHGHINFINSDDNVVRQVPVNVASGNESYSSFSEVLAAKSWKNKTNRIYFCPTKYFNKVRAVDVLNNLSDEELQAKLAGKIVMIGVTVADLHDYVYTPLSKGDYMYGVYAHANAVNTLLADKQFHELPLYLDFALFFLVILGFLVYLLLTEYYTITNASVLAVLLIATWWSNMLLFDSGWQFNGWYYLLSLILIYLYVLVVHYILLFIAKQDLRRTFGFYLSEAVLNQLIANPDLVKLGGVKREMTVLFSDLRGFTSLSEKLSPEQLVKILNIYLTEMSDVVLNENGVIDKYMGDAIMAFWGAPLDDARHAHNACLAAWKMKNLLVEMNNTNAWQEDVILKLGIGVNSGEMIVGNMGGAKRFDYTVMGDSVNLGSRLEGLNKIYGSEIIISQSVYPKVKDEFATRILDRVAVKGKTEPITIYELLGPVAELSTEKKYFAEQFASMFEKYLAKDFSGALAILEKMPAEDLSVTVYLDRCREYLKNPPAENWDGVYVLKTK